MIIVGNTSYWGYPFAASIDVDDAPATFVAKLKSDRMEFDVADNSGTVIAECLAHFRPGIFRSFRAPDFLIKDVGGKVPALKLGKAGWMSARINWGDHEADFRLCRRHERIELLGVELDLDRKSFRGICKNPAVHPIPTHMLVAVLYFAWVRFSRQAQS
jgi:hypothetical protein